MSDDDQLRRGGIDVEAMRGRRAALQGLQADAYERGFIDGIETTVTELEKLGLDPVAIDAFVARTKARLAAEAPRA